MDLLKWACFNTGTIQWIDWEISFQIETSYPHDGDYRESFMEHMNMFPNTHAKTIHNIMDHASTFPNITEIVIWDVSGGKNSTINCVVKRRVFNSTRLKP